MFFMNEKVHQSIRFDEIPDLISESQLARWIPRQPITFYRWRKQSPPRIPYCRIGNEVYYLKGDILNAIQNCRVS